MTIEQDYLRRIDELDTEITKLRKQRQSLFIEYMHYIARRKVDPKKWIGKLCRFWDENYLMGKYMYGILTDFDGDKRPFQRDYQDYWYQRCEPVKPDDDIIYKGE